MGPAAAVAPPATPSTGFASSRLWSVLAGGSSPAPPAQQPQHSQPSQPSQQQQWGYSGPEDLPPSLAPGGSNGGAAAGAIGGAGAAPMGAAGGSRGWGKGEPVVHEEGEGSTGEEEVYVDGADVDAVGAGVPAAAGAQRAQEAAGGGGGVEEYQEASEEIEATGGLPRVFCAHSLSLYPPCSLLVTLFIGGGLHGL